MTLLWARSHLSQQRLQFAPQEPSSSCHDSETEGPREALVPGGVLLKETGQRGWCSRWLKLFIVFWGQQKMNIGKIWKTNSWCWTLSDNQIIFGFCNYKLSAWDFKFLFSLPFLFSNLKECFYSLPRPLIQKHRTDNFTLCYLWQVQFDKTFLPIPPIYFPELKWFLKCCNCPLPPLLNTCQWLLISFDINTHFLSCLRRPFTMWSGFLFIVLP